MEQITYMVLLIDRQKAKAFTLLNKHRIEIALLFDEQVPQKVKHGDDTWDAPDKIFRHIEDHLQRHLELIASFAEDFYNHHAVDALIIGGHIPLFGKVKKLLPEPLSRKLKGEFITELKGPLDLILKKTL